MPLRRGHSSTEPWSRSRWRWLRARRAARPAVADSLADFSTDALLMVDAGGFIRAANRAAGQLLAREPGALVGLRFDDAVPLPPRDDADTATRAPDPREAGGYEISSFPAESLAGPGGRIVRIVPAARSPGRAPPPAGAPLQAAAQSDALTRLPNRRALHEMLERLTAARPSTGPGRLALILVDLDDFRRINEWAGPSVGDEVLAIVAVRLCDVVSCTVDPGADHLVARIGGDEFAVLVDGISGPAEAEDLGDRLREAVAMPCVVRGRRHQVTASAGIVLARPGAALPANLLRDVELSLARAQAEGRGCQWLWRPELAAQSIRRAALVSDLHDAVGRGELRLVYQPIVDILTGVPVGAEALLRWTHPIHGEVAPSEFLPLAEEHGLIDGIGAWVLETAARQVGSWRRLYGRDLLRWISVNVSARQFDDPSSLVAAIGRIKAAGFPLDLLEIEITETAMTRNADDTRLVLAQLREQGVRIAIDDFGVGYSSFETLANYRFDALKVDRSFIARIVRREGFEVARTILRLADALGLPAIAEGVETPEQAQFLAREGCRYAQGFLFARPMEPARCGAFLLAGTEAAERPELRRRVRRTALDGG